MISYQLAQKLNNAGFPGIICTSREHCLPPNLSELIKECMYTRFDIQVDTSGASRVIEIGREYEHLPDWTDSPESAMAYFYLELKKKS